MSLTPRQREILNGKRPARKCSRHGWKIDVDAILAEPISAEMLAMASAALAGPAVEPAKSMEALSAFIIGESFGGR